MLLKWWHLEAHSYQGEGCVYGVEVAQEDILKSLPSAWD